MKLKRIEIPDHFNFKDFDIYDFDKALKLFNWDLEDESIVIDFSNCFHANYQALSLLVLYIWFLKTKNCNIEFVFDKYDKGASEMWKLMGAKGWSQVLFKDNQNFISNEYKPLIALRNQQDFSKSLTKAESYTKGFNVEYEKTLRYVVSELLYNTLEHGKRYDRFRTSSVRIPSIIQLLGIEKRTNSTS